MIQLFNRIKALRYIFTWGAFLFFITATGNAQESPYHGSATILGGGTSSGKIPFWLRSDQYGSLPLDKGSVSLIAQLGKDYNTTGKKFFDWGASFEGRANGGYKGQAILVEGYGKVKLGIFQALAGRRKDITGLCDSTLSTGSFTVSGNALGVPKLEVSIPEYYNLPFLGRLFAFKGSLVHGMLGKTLMKNHTENMEVISYLHQLTFYGRLGKPEWKLKLFGGINHEAFWGHENQYYDGAFELSTFKTFEHVAMGKVYYGSKIGNHLGSVDLGLTYDFPGIQLFVYRQNFYDEGALYYLANIRDGLNGVSIKNKKESQQGFRWKKMLLEVFYSKNQAGELWSPVTPSGDEDYYNNFQYRHGWSYKELCLGNPLVSNRKWLRSGFPNDPFDYFINNRIIAIHYGYEGAVQEWEVKWRSTFSWNYGTFSTSTAGRSTGSDRFFPDYGIFSVKKQFSWYGEASRKLKKGVYLGFVGAFDAGELYYNSVGAFVKVGKVF